MKPCNCGDPLSGAKIYQSKKESSFQIRAKKMDRRFAVLVEGKVVPGNIGDWLMETYGQIRPVKGILSDADFQAGYQELA